MKETKCVDENEINPFEYSAAMEMYVYVYVLCVHCTVMSTAFQLSIKIGFIVFSYDCTFNVFVSSEIHSQFHSQSRYLSHI